MFSDNISPSIIELQAMKLGIDFNDIRTLLKDRWRDTSGESGKKTFDYFKDIDLLLAYGFDFENGTWLEFLGYMERLFNERTALVKRVGDRSWNKPPSKPNVKLEQQKQDKQSQDTKLRYSLDKMSEDIGQKQLDDYMLSKRK
jgi:hypothetical protein